MTEQEAREKLLFGRAYLKPIGEIEGYQTDQELKKEQPPLCKAALGTKQYALTTDFSSLKIEDDFLKIVNTRKSHRVYTGETMNLTQLSYLLWCTQGVKEIRGKKYATIRTVPCGGARHEFETYMTVRDVKGLPEGLYHYLPMTHSLECVEGTFTKEEVSLMCEGQTWCAKANVVFFYSYVPYRCEWRYGIYSSRMVMADLGHISENLYLALTSIGLGGCAIGAVDGGACDAKFSLDGEEEFVCYGFPFGCVSEQDKDAEDAFYSFVKEQGL